MYLLKCILLAGLASCSVAFLDSLYAQLDANCDGTNSFVCRNSKCVSNSKRCDGHTDCLDGSDEEDCELFFCKAPNYFKCLNTAKCIFNSFVCDQEDDCGDYSDESNCTDFKLMLAHQSNCSTEEWQCADRLCIPTDFVCNGETDCLDGTDETIGCTKDLHCDAFKCKNGHCIPNEWVCDRKNDCHDNSDELDCQSHIKPKDCELDKKFFLCANNLTCINLTNVCDNNPQCPDKSDEGGLCSAANSCQNHQCSHDCVQLPTGPKCLCPSGYHTIDDKTCKDINECEIYGICDQKCKNTPGSYECYCDEKYELQSDKTTCKVVGGEAMMVISSNSEIRGYFLQSQVLFPVAKQLKQAVGVAYDGNHIYWTDIFSEHESLVRSLEDGSQRELLVTSGLGTPEDLAVDWITGNIYFTDSEMQHIGVCSNNGAKCTVLLNHDINKPRGIVLNPLEGEMYWSDWGKKPEIAKSKMDGSQDVGFVTSNIKWPNGLAIDFPNERLYWTDAKLLTLESIRLDGTDRRVVLDGIVKHPYAIALFENRLYWSDLNTHSVQSCDKFTGKNHHTLIKEKKQYIYGLHIYHSALKPRSVNPCTLSFCSDICLISGPNSYTCACPQDKILSSDKHTCKEQFKKQTLIIGASNMLLRLEHQLLGKHEIEGLPTIAKKIGALAYSPINNTMFVYDVETHTIITVALTSGYSSPLLTENIGKISAMDYDYLGNNLYWTDSDKKTIEMLSMKTMSRKVVLHDMGGEEPASIALIPEEGVMFVAMISTSRDSIHIDRIKLDGTTRTHVVESGLIGPVALRYDMALHRVFWTDGGTGNIESTSADGDDRHGFRALRTTPVAITTLSTDLFWTNHNSRRLYWARKDNSQNFNKKITLDLPESTDVMYVVSTTLFQIPSHPCQTNNGNCSHLCIPSEKTAVCACPLGMELNEDGFICASRILCLSDEFYCHKSNMCIPKTMRCNNHKDCMNGEDEEDCMLERQCPNSYFKCANGDCILKNLVCDLHFDCKDRSDEIDCSNTGRKCPDNHLTCDGDLCIHNHFKCDGLKDCNDGTDELECLITTCASNQFRCLSGACIPKNWECDHEYDCLDLSDEHPGCFQKLCSSNQFKCNNKLCIDYQLRCNNVDDCGDGSDEFYCKQIQQSTCRANEFQCTSDKSKCIPLEARCNGTSECPHHEDEQGCSDCHIDEFECTNKRCISSIWICDGSDDCGDNSDELICSKNNQDVTETKNVPCDHGFRCKSGACIDYNLVCNGEENCYDGSDENGACISSCKGVSNPCQHKCQATPSGPMCLCNDGYELSGDGHTCKDIAECSRDPPICSQLCTERVGGYSCECFDGFMIRSDKTSCKSIGDSMTMFFTIDNEIRMLSQSDRSLSLIHADDNPQITGLDVSTPDQFVYFSIEESESIHRLNLKTNKRGYIRDVGKPQKLAVDWQSQNIYYVDADHIDKAIRVCNFNDEKCAKIISVDPHSQVSSIAVDSVNRYIFYTLTTWWIFNSPSTVMYKANLDGSKVHEIVKNTPGSVSGITFDYNKKLLYYIDQHNGVIYKMNYDGFGKSIVISNLTRPNGLSYFEDHLYYLTNFGYMGKCKLYGRERNCDTFRLSAYNADLFAISQSSKQPIGENMCTEHVCNHICVPSDVGIRCLCESGKVVEEGVQCDRNDRSSKDEGRIPTFGLHNNVEDEESSSVAIPVIILLFFALVLGAIYYIMKKRSSGKFNISMRFHNPIYGVQNETARVMLQPGEHEYCNPVISTQKDFQTATNAILEKVTPLVKFDD